MANVNSGNAKSKLNNVCTDDICELPLMNDITLTDTNKPKERKRGKRKALIKFLLRQNEISLPELEEYLDPDIIEDLTFVSREL